MYNIVVCCVSALSSNILVAKMKQVAKEKEIKCLIWTVGEGGLDLAHADADVILLAPQVRHLEARLNAKELHKVPVVLIDDIDFGQMNGEVVLEKAIAAIQK